MNFNGFDFDENTKNALKSLDKNGRIPHAVIIECGDREKSLAAAKYLSMYAVCTQSDRPCGKCSQCHRAAEAAHADIRYAYPEKKSKSYSIEQMRDIAKDAYIRPNEADAKVYIFEDADSRLQPVAQNSFLKLLEEPPQNVHFILLCENSKKLLVTILSRCAVIKLESGAEFGEEAVKNAADIVNGILSSREYDLLTAVNVLSDRERAEETLSAVKLILHDGLAVLSGGKAVFDGALGKKLSARFTRDRIMQMLELTESAKHKLTQNININLLTTWLCGEYRRISWQR